MIKSIVWMILMLPGPLWRAFHIKWQLNHGTACLWFPLKFIRAITSNRHTRQFLRLCVCFCYYLQIWQKCQFWDIFFGSGSCSKLAKNLWIHKSSVNKSNVMNSVPHFWWYGLIAFMNHGILNGCDGQKRLQNCDVNRKVIQLIHRKQ